MPCFQVRAAGTATFTALVDRDEEVVVQLEEGNDALALAVGAGNVAARSANRSPATAEAACPFGEVGIFSDATLHDALDGIIHVVEVAGRELRMAGAGIEKSGGGRAEATALVEFVESLGLYFLFFLCREESHGDAHPEELGCLNTARDWRDLWSYR